jgi:hypothetical protein
MSRVVRRLVLVLGVLVALVLIGRVLLDPVAAWYTARTLAANDTFKASFSRVHVSVIPPAYEIHNFKLIELPDGRWDEPLAYVEHARASILWRELLRGHVVAKARVERPKLMAVRKHEKKAKQAPEIGEEMGEAMPLKLDRLEVVDGEVLLGIGKGKRAPQLWLHEVNLVAENMALRKAMMEGEPATLRMRGRVQQSGRLKVDGAMDPWAKRLTFESKASLLGLRATELYAFLAHEADIAPESGTVDVFVEVEAKNGVLHGGVKPVLKNVELASRTDELGDRIKAALADASIDLLSDEKRDAVATTIPVRGRIEDPQVQLLPTVLGVIRNAFVVGLRAGFSNLPPPVAANKENPLKQAWDAITDDDKPPEAQPEKGDKADKADKRQARKRPAKQR